MFYFLCTHIVFAETDLKQVNQSIQQYNEYAVFDLPTLTTKQYEDLEKGQVLSILDQTDLAQPQRAVGMLLSPVPAKNLWISCQDPHFAQQSSTIEKRISLASDNSAEWYGFMDLPWPFSDRHWVVKVWNNQKMATRTKNSCWEHPWNLIEDGAAKITPHLGTGTLQNIDQEMVDSAIYTPVSKGAWALIQVDERNNLLIYHATTVVGGNISSDLVAQFVRSSLNDLLKGIESRARKEIVSHYVNDHDLLIGGDNKPVELFPVQ